MELNSSVVIFVHIETYLIVMNKTFFRSVRTASDALCCCCPLLLFLIQTLCSRNLSHKIQYTEHWTGSMSYHVIYYVIPCWTMSIDLILAQFDLVLQNPSLSDNVLKNSTFIPLQLALDSARFEFTLKMRLNRIWPKDPTHAIFLKSWVFKDVKYDIPMY